MDLLCASPGQPGPTEKQHFCSRFLLHWPKAKEVMEARLFFAPNVMQHGAVLSFVRSMHACLLDLSHMEGAQATLLPSCQPMFALIEADAMRSVAAPRDSPLQNLLSFARLCLPMDRLVSWRHLSALVFEAKMGKHVTTVLLLLLFLIHAKRCEGDILSIQILIGPGLQSVFLPCSSLACPPNGFREGNGLA